MENICFLCPIRRGYSNQDHGLVAGFFNKGRCFLNPGKHKAIMQMYNHPKSLCLEVLQRSDWEVEI